MSRLDELHEKKWFQVLTEEAAKSSITEAARKIGYSRTAVSLVLRGTYDGGTDAIAAKVMDTFTDQVLCPFLDAEINRGQCRDYQSRPMPTSSPKDLRHWMTCRDGCVHSDLKFEEIGNA